MTSISVDSKIEPIYTKISDCQLGANKRVFVFGLCLFEELFEGVTSFSVSSKSLKT